MTRYDIIESDVFKGQCDMIVVPISELGEIPSPYREKLMQSDVVTLPEESSLFCGEIYIHRSYFKYNDNPTYVAFACVKDKYGFSTYAAVYQIAVNLRRYIDKYSVKSVAVPILGAERKGVDPILSFKIFLSGWSYDGKNISTQLMISVPQSDIREHVLSKNYRIIKNARFLFDKEIPDPVDALHRMSTLFCDIAFDDLVNDEDFYYQKAQDKLWEFLDFGKYEDTRIYTNIKKEIEREPRFTLNRFIQVKNGEERFKKDLLILCGELLAYCDPGAFAKTEWNKYPDKRTVLNISLVRQREWILNLIKIKENQGEVMMASSSAVRNTLWFLMEPRRFLTMASITHLGMVIRTFRPDINVRQADWPANVELVYDLFHKIGLRCKNRVNDGVLYSKLLYEPDIRKLWDKNAIMRMSVAGHKNYDKFLPHDRFDDPLRYARKMIFLNRQSKSEVLDLGNCGITDLSALPELFECRHLKKLILSNEWAEYENGRWVHFQSDNMGLPNILSSIPKEISRLNKLERLVCGGDWSRMEEDPRKWTIGRLEGILLLKELKLLNISNNQVRTLAGIMNLSKLEVLHANNNKIIDASPLKDLKASTEIYLSNNEIKDVAPLNNLKNLKTVDLHANRISDLLPAKKLIQRIGISNTKWQKGIFNVAKNPLTQPPMEIVAGGVKAVMAYFEEKDKVTNTEVKVILVGNSAVGKTTLADYMNPERRSVKQHATEGLEEREFEKNADNMPGLRNKCNIRLFDFGGHDYYHDTHHLFFGMNTIYLLLWDAESNRLAPREVEQCVGKREKALVKTQDFPLPYWLDSIRYFARGVRATNFSPNMQENVENNYEGSLLLIQNKVQTSADIVHLNNSSLAKDYPFIYDIINISLDKSRHHEEGQDLAQEWEDRNIKHFESLFAEMLNNNPVLGAKLPRYYVAIRDKIKEYQGKPVMAFGEFMTYCQRELGEDVKIDEERCRRLADYLKQVGVILWYPKENNPDKIYIDKKWVTQSIHKLLENDVVVCGKGEFELRDVAAMMKNKGGAPSEDAETWAKNLIEIMTEFKMIFPHPFEQNKYIAPLYLPDMAQSTKLVTLDLNVAIPARRFEYVGFIHKHVILDFFHKYASMIVGEAGSKTCYYWKDGLILKERGNDCMVMIRFSLGTNEGKACIDLYDMGNAQKCKFLDRIIADIKEINDGYQIQEQVTLDGKDYLPLGMLTEYAKKGIHYFTKSDWLFNKKGQHGDALSMIEDSKTYNLNDYMRFLPKGIRGKKVFISYSKTDMDKKNTLVRHLAGLVDGGLIEEPWCCTYLEGGDEWDPEIQEYLEKADIVIFLVSAVFYTTDYIVKKEIQPTIDRYDKNNHSVKILPVILEHCMWQRKSPYNLGRFTALPFEAKPITDYGQDALPWYLIARAVEYMVVRDIDPGKPLAISREILEHYERQTKGKLNNNSR